MKNNKKYTFVLRLCESGVKSDVKGGRKWCENGRALALTRNKTIGKVNVYRCVTLCEPFWRWSNEERSDD